MVSTSELKTTHYTEHMGADAVVPLPQCALHLKDSPGKGRGVFASEPIKKGTMVSLSPVLVFPAEVDCSSSSSSSLSSSSSSSSRGGCSAEREVLNSYTYTWGTCQAMALGLGSMFNHARHSNVGFVVDKTNLLIQYFAMEDIAADAELCINYGPKVWFSDTDAADGDDEYDDDSDEGGNFLSRLEL